MTLEQIKAISKELELAILYYKSQQDFDEIGLEQVIDDLLRRLPQDIVYAEWYDLTDIRNLIENTGRSPVSKEMTDACMKNLHEFGQGFIDNESVQTFLDETLRCIHEEQQKD